MRIQDQTVLITGATRGIGRALTEQLTGLGASVIAVGRDPELLAGLHSERVTPYAVDLADPGAVDTFADEVTWRHPGLSVVINNAAVQVHADLLADDPPVRPELRREIAVNLDAVVAICAGLLPHLRQQPSAAVVNITTGLAVAPKRTAPVYCATKAGVRTFTRAIRYQCEQSAPHIRIAEAMMPLVDTDMTRGRGSGKISASTAAAAVIEGVRRGSPEIYIGKARLLPTLMRVSPSLGYRMLRNG
ncbi:SDR family oxidoreductase [Actinoplanes subglobosus]|uniref:SDR family oxidoreductase n=1 Tax=Actinoplanes subglobosus TaxID=1547892 RepID=A0ABV8IX55_9ACTN